MASENRGWTGRGHQSPDAPPFCWSRLATPTRRQGGGGLGGSGGARGGCVCCRGRAPRVMACRKPREGLRLSGLRRACPGSWTRKEVGALTEVQWEGGLELNLGTQVWDGSEVGRRRSGGNRAGGGEAPASGRPAGGPEGPLAEPPSAGLAEAGRGPASLQLLKSAGLSQPLCVG